MSAIKINILIIRMEIAQKLSSSFVGEIEKPTILGVAGVNSMRLG